MAETSNNKEIEQVPDEIQKLASALLFLFAPVDRIEAADLVASTATIYDRIQEIFPDLYTASQTVLALKHAGFRMYNAGELDIRWLLANKVINTLS